MADPEQKPPASKSGATVALSQGAPEGASIDMETGELPWTGERLVPSIGGDIALEHIHRYAIAAELVENKDVLDIACGEGYGANLLASRARGVTGVDISVETVRHARRKYLRPNLNFLQGSCTAIPLPDRSVDVVVSFETLEHIVEQEQFVVEVRRVLRPGGLFIVSTPDKVVYTDKLGNRNIYHPRELDAGGFADLLGSAFACTAMLNQRVALGSFVSPTEGGVAIEGGTHRGNFDAVGFTPEAAGHGRCHIGLA